MMKLVKKTPEFSIYLRGDNRYAVRGGDRRPINGESKVRILVAEGLLKAEPAGETRGGKRAGERGPRGRKFPKR